MEMDCGRAGGGMSHLGHLRAPLLQGWALLLPPWAGDCSSTAFGGFMGIQVRSLSSTGELEFFHQKMPYGLL